VPLADLFLVDREMEEMNAGLSPKARSMSVNVGVKNKHLEGSAGVKGRKIKLKVYGHLWSVSVKIM
jgi:hypothetical protein